MSTGDAAQSPCGLQPQDQGLELNVQHTESSQDMSMSLSIA